MSNAKSMAPDLQRYLHVLLLNISASTTKLLLKVGLQMIPLRHCNTQELSEVEAEGAGAHLNHCNY